MKQEYIGNNEGVSRNLLFRKNRFHSPILLLIGSVLWAACGGSTSSNSTHDPGTLDLSFNSTGKLTTSIGSDHDEARAVTLQSDGKIIVVGYSINGTHKEFALARYNSDGSLDTAFGDQGTKIVSIGSGHASAKAVALQTDGKIVVVGYSYNGSNFDFALARYTAAGQLDTAFGTDGKKTTSIGSYDAEANAVALQTDGKIVVAGHANNGSNYDFALARYSSDGQLDTAFGDQGKKIVSIGSGHASAKAVALQTDGKIVVAGHAHNGSNYDFALARYTTAGQLDTAFGTDGKKTTSIGSTSAFANAVAIQPDGKIVAAGYSFDESGKNFALARYNSNGSLDDSFGDGGKRTTDIGNDDDVANAVAIQTDGKIVVAGFSNNGTSKDFALARYSSTGAVDTTFGTNGIKTTSIGSEDDEAYAVAIQPDGKIVAVGYSSNGSNYDFALIRVWP